MNGNLKLTPFEWSMLVQSESEPMTFVIRLVFDGRVCIESLQLSVSEAAVSHPLLTSCIRSDDETLSIYEAAPNLLTWVPSGSPPEIIKLAVDHYGIPIATDSQSDRIDLVRENGLKVLVSDRGKNTDVRFMFHHAVTDGLGAFKYIEDVLAKYHAGQTQTRISLPAVDTDLLQLRNSNCKTSLPWHLRVLRSCFILPRRIFRMIGQTPAKLAATNPAFKTAANQPVSGVLEMPALTLSESETTAISRYAKLQGSTTNELLIHQLFKVLSKWNQNSSTDELGKLRVIVPFSLRDSSHEAMPAANCVSMVYVDASKSVDQIESLGEISQQIAYIRKWQIKYSWNQTASFAFRSKLIEALLRKQAGRHLCTTVLSNLGQPFKHSMLPVQKDGRLQVGDLILRSAHVAAPTTTNTIATFAVLFYARRLTLTMNYNKTKMSRADAQSLIDLFGKSLRGLSSQ